MNKILVLLSLLIFSKTTFAQKDSIALDDKGLYIYYKVVDMATLNNDTLNNRAARFFKQINPVVNKAYADKDFVLVASADGKTITGNGHTILYKPSLAKHPDAKLTFSFKMEIQGSKYRYWFTNFEYHAGTRDRYSNYVFAKNGLPLEKKTVTLNKTDVDHFLDDAAKAAIQFGARLKKALASDAPPIKMRLDTTRRIHINKTF